MFLNEITLTGATQFDPATPVATFLEQTDITELGSGVVPRILGYSYNSLGTAQTITLHLSPAAGSAANLQIVLESPTDPVNSFNETCGKGGQVVPRLFGRTNSGSQALDTPLGTINDTAPMVLLFTTLAKDNTGTFRVWWDYVELGGAL